MWFTLDLLRYSLAIDAAIAVIIYCAGLAIYRLYFHPLAKFPGPRIGALTLWYDFYFNCVKDGQFIWEIERLHKKYGPIVRIVPDELHIDDPDYYDTIYAPASKRRDKYKWVLQAGALTSSFATVEHDHHRLRRSALNPFFSKQSVMRLEPMIVSKVQKLCERFRTLADTGEVLRLDTAFMALTMDIITQYAYSRSYDYLDKPDFALEWKNNFVRVLESNALIRHIPWLTSVMEALPPGLVKAAIPQIAGMVDFQCDVKQQIERIFSSQAKDDENTVTIFHALLGNENLPAAEKTLRRLEDEGQAVIAAGSETTAKAVTTMAFYLLNQADTLRVLKEELRQAMPNSWDSPTWAQLERLPFLTATIQEGLRLSYGLTTRQPRIARDEVLVYGNWEIPPGVRVINFAFGACTMQVNYANRSLTQTPVSSTTYFISMNPDIFPEPEKFNPARWLNPRPTKANPSGRLDKYLTSFSKGSRQCAGINMAYAEMYLTIAYVFRRFEMKLFETTREDVDIVRDCLVALPKPDSKGVRATVTAIEK